MSDKPVHRAEFDPAGVHPDDCRRRAVIDQREL